MYGIYVGNVNVSVNQKFLTFRSNVADLCRVFTLDETHVFTLPVFLVPVLCNAHV